MRTSIITKTLGVLALLGSSAGMAATVNISASLTNDPNTGTSNLLVTPGQNFFVFVKADVPNTFAATMGLAFNSSVVSYVSGAALAPWNVFVKNSPTTANPTVFDVETPSATSGSPGVYNVAVLTFNAIAGGAASIVINDDGGIATGWFDADSAEYIPNSYTQADVQVVPAPGALLLLATALGGLVVRRKLAA